MSKFYEMIDTIKALREPINGCPWDLKQNVKSLLPSLLEEVYELTDGVAQNDNENIVEELGDIIFTSSLISYIAQQEGISTIDNIIDGVNQKMISRHPHVFKNNQKLNCSEEVLKQWEEIKVKKEGRSTNSLLERIPRSTPPIDMANEIQKKVAKVGFDWESTEGIFDKINEEVNEVKVEIESGDRDKLEEEIGDLLFSVINLSRFLDINPSIALNKTNNKFKKRFTYIEEEMKKLELPLSKDNFKIMDKLWDKSKE